MNLHGAVGAPQNAARQMRRSTRAAVATRPTEMHFRGRVAADESHTRRKKCNKYEGPWLRSVSGTTGRTTVLDADRLNTNEVVARGARPPDTSTLRRLVVEARNLEDIAVLGRSDRGRGYVQPCRRSPSGGRVCQRPSLRRPRRVIPVDTQHGSWRRSPQVLSHASPCYIDCFAGRPDISELETIVQMEIKLVVLDGHFLYLAGVVCDKGRSA